MCLIFEELSVMKWCVLNTKVYLWDFKILTIFVFHSMKIHEFFFTHDKNIWFMIKIELLCLALGKTHSLNSILIKYWTSHCTNVKQPEWKFIKYQLY